MDIHLKDLLTDKVNEKKRIYEKEKRKENIILNN